MLLILLCIVKIYSLKQHGIQLNGEGKGKSVMKVTVDKSEMNGQSSSSLSPVDRYTRAGHADIWVLTTQFNLQISLRFRNTSSSFRCIRSFIILPRVCHTRCSKGKLRSSYGQTQTKSMSVNIKSSFQWVTDFPAIRLVVTLPKTVEKKFS